ncbi:DEAD/DEAH box helicase [Streptomyces bacillaris]|uniref:DEAD/DEAH box helicase n=1 Tax=Streptomyces bacillaris TaxID=68179 RepID=UPI003EB9EB3B
MNGPAEFGGQGSGASDGVPVDDDMARLRYSPWGEAGAGRELLGRATEVFYDTPEAAERLGLPHMRRIPSGTYSPGHGLPSGLYIFESRRSSGCVAALSLCGGTAPVPAQHKRLRDVEDGHPLHRALLLYRQWREWPEREAVSAVPRYAVGDLVRIVDQSSNRTVTRVRAVGDDGFQYTLRGADGRTSRVFEDNLEPVTVASDDPEQWVLGAPAPAADIALTLTLAKLSTPLTDTVYSFQSSRTVFRPYQFRPVLKLMNSDRQRLLIADEVGLGKTIEAGLIWNELEQRTHLRRAAARLGGTHFRGLVVCPAALVHKWQAEMDQRFDRRLRVLDNDGMEELLRLLRRGDNEQPFAGVISLERLRRAGQLTELAELRPSFDLVIVDEAHYVRNAATRSHAAVSQLADWADALVLLSATPLNLGNQDLYNLVHLLDPSTFPDPHVFERQLEPNRHLNAVAARLADGAGRTPGGANSLLPTLDRVRGSRFGQLVAQRPEFNRLRQVLATPHALTAHQLSEARRCIADLNALAGIVNRTRKADTPDAKAVRVPEDVRVTWTGAEREFYDELHAWCLRRAARSGTAAGFAAQMWLRQAASCIPAMQQRLRERFSGTVTTSARDVWTDPAGGTGLVNEEEVILADDAEAEFTPEELAQASDHDVDELVRLPGLLRPLSRDTKFEAFVGMLRDARAKGLRQAMVFSFFKRTLEYLESRLNDEFRVRVMHGGVPQQERPGIMADFRAGEFDLLLVSEVGSEGLDFEFCNVLVNYDLPWNPMRVEQRIGRLDRFGQKHEKIFIFNMQVPGTIETDIFQRLYQRIGVFQDSIGELEPILRGRLRELHRVVLDPSLSEEERRRQIDRIGVARVDRDKDIATLEKAREILTGLDDLLVEGFDQHSPGRGRYLGPREIRGLVEAFLQQTGHGSMERVPGADDLVDITGSGRLRRTMYEAMNAGAFTVPSGSDLLARLGGPYQSLRACFTARTSTETGAPLLSVRHPLVRAAHWWFTERAETLGRYGQVRIPGLPPGSRYLVEVRLARVDGARPRRELWTTAVDTATLKEVPEVGAALLTCLAGGDLAEPSQPLPAGVSASLPEILETVHDLAAEREFTAKRTYEAENSTLAAGRRATVEDTFRHKIEQARRLAQEVDSTSIRRLHAARVGHLETQRDARLAQMDRDSRFSLSTETVALVLVEG